MLANSYATISTKETVLTKTKKNLKSLLEQNIELGQSNLLLISGLKRDIGEKHNVAGQHPEIVAELMKLVKQAQKELGDKDRWGEGIRFFKP